MSETSKSAKFRMHKKKAFLEAMQRNLGNITESSREIGIDRNTYYNWCKSDPKFAAEIDNIAESCIDFAESQLFKQISEGNSTSTIFYLKTKGKKRGYVETTEITGKDGKDLVPARVDVSKLTDEQLKALADIEVG